jgi:hypothetical protein
VPSDQRWQPTTPDERYVTLDVLRGLALFGVLLINLHTLFRVSLLEHILHFHTDPGAYPSRAHIAITVLDVYPKEHRAVFGVGGRGIDLTSYANAVLSN